MFWSRSCWLSLTLRGWVGIEEEEVGGLICESDEKWLEGGGFDVGKVIIGD